MVPSSGVVLDDGLCRELFDHPDTIRIVLRGVTLGSRLGCLQECLRALCKDDWAAKELVSAVQVINHSQIILVITSLIKLFKFPMIFRQSTAFVKTSTARLKLMIVKLNFVSPYLEMM